MKTIEAFETYFSLQGRLNRQNFAILMLTLAIPLGVSEVFVSLNELRTFAFGGTAEPSPHSSAILVFQLSLFVASIFPIVRRWHDLDRSGAYWWLCQIPLVNVVFYCILFFAKGTNGPNRFGPDPLGSVGEAAEAELRTSVLRELESAATEPAMWAQALQEAHGDQDRARARYLDLRVAKLAKKLHRLHAQREDGSAGVIDLGNDGPVLLPLLDKLAPDCAIDSIVVQSVEASVKVYERELASQERQLGQEHLDIVSTLEKLAELLANKLRYSHAELLLQRALAIREKSLGPEHPDVARSLGALADIYDKQGQGKHKTAELRQRADRIVASSGTTSH